MLPYTSPPQNPQLHNILPSHVKQKIQKKILNLTSNDFQKIQIINLTVSKLRREPTALAFISLSNLFILFLNFVLHSVTAIVTTREEETEFEWNRLLIQDFECILI